MKSNYTINHVEELKKDLKTLKKKFITIENDLKIFEKALLVDPQKLPGITPVSFEEIKIKVGVKAYKAKKFHCESLENKGSRSGIRVIYGFWPNLNKITILQIYYKERENTECDLKRLNEYFGV